MMIYKVNYEHDNGYRKDDKVAVISSDKQLSSKIEVRDFFYQYIYRQDDDLIKITDYEPIWNDFGNRLVLEKTY